LPGRPGVAPQPGALPRCLRSARRGVVRPRSMLRAGARCSPRCRRDPARSRCRPRRQA
jgi:hypothetical protein